MILCACASRLWWRNRPWVYALKLENGWTDFYEILYGRYAIADYSKLILFINFLQLVLPSWRKNKVGRWDADDVITRDPLRMRGWLVIILQYYLCVKKTDALISIDIQ
jgi:hypothetical protein